MKEIELTVDEQKEAINKYDKLQDEADGAVTNDTGWVYKLKKPVKYNGEEYTTLTFDFDKLTGADSIAIMNEIAMRRGRVVVEPVYDSDYRAAMAARACTAPIGVDIFNVMSLPDFNRIIGKARSFMTSLF